METEERLMPDALEVALTTLLRRAPAARVGALSAEGLFVDLPPSLELYGQEVLAERSPVDMVTSGDLGKLIQVWESAKAKGGDQSKLRMADGSTCFIYLFDMTEVHGTYIAVLDTVEGEDHTEAAPERDVEPVRQRVSRMRKDALGVISHVDDDAAAEMFGWSRDELMGMRPVDFMHPDDGPAIVDAWFQLLSAPGGMFTTRSRFRCKDGRWLWVDIMNHNLLESEGHVASEMIDASDVMEAQLALRHREQLLRRLTDALPSGVLNVDVVGSIVYRNDRLFQILGVEPTESLGELFTNVADDDRAALRSAIDAAVRVGADADLEVSVAVAPGTERTCSVFVRTLQGADGVRRGAVVSVSDITDTAVRRAELEVQATFDALTGCRNRGSIFAALDTALATHGGVGTAVLFVDLDGFKPVNDRLGHSAGDELLRLVADRLRGAVRTHDVVGRIGGDEFMVVCPDIARVEIAQDVAARLEQAVREPAVIAGTQLEPSASIGLAFAPNDGTAAQDLVERADRAMYAVKQRRGR